MIYKFRGQRLDTREWVYGSLIITSLRYGYKYEIRTFNTADEEEAPNDETYEVYFPTVGQFTGLKDANGKEVWEGDILRIPLKDEYDQETYNSFEVFYHDNDASPTDCGLVLGRMKTHGNSGGGYCGYKLIPRDVGKMVVIGSIHENPELLGKD